VLRALDLEQLLERVGGLDVERDWDDALSLGEQQLLAIARVVLAAPVFVFLERPYATLGADHADRVLHLLGERSITYVTLGDGGDRPGDHRAVLEITDDGGWTWNVFDAQSHDGERSARRS
jgi:putative ATP-binding cassette transporter